MNADMESNQLWAGKGSMNESESEYLLNAREESDEKACIRDSKEASSLRKLCVIVSCMVQLFVTLGIAYGLSVMYAELIIVFNADRSYAALIQSLNMGINMVCGVFITIVIKKIGAGVSIMVGAVMAFVGLFASAFANDIATIIVCTGAITGFAFGLCQLSSFLTVGWLFHEDPGIFLIIMTLGVSFGQLALPPLYEVFISTYAWSGAFILLSGIALQCIPFGLIIHLSNDYYITESKQSKKDRAVCIHTSIFTDAIIWIIWTNSFLLGITGNIEPWFIVDHMISRGFSLSDGALTISVMGGGNIVGKIIGAAIKFGCKKTPTLYHWIYLGILLAILHAVIPYIYNFWALLFSCAFFGCVIGLVWSQVVAVSFEASGLDRFPQTFALLNLTVGIGNIIGSLLGGYIKDTYGSYDIDFFIGVGASLYISISTAVAVCINRKRSNV